MENWLSHTHDYCPTCTEQVTVTLPTRKPPVLPRVREGTPPTPPSLDFQLAGASLNSQSRSEEGLGSREEVTRGRRMTVGRPRGQRSNDNHVTNALGLVIASVAASPPSLGEAPRSRKVTKPQARRPPRPEKREEVESVELMVGGGREMRVGSGSSPVDIVRRISSVHVKGRQRRATSLPRSPGQAEVGLVSVTGTRIS